MKLSCIPICLFGELINKRTLSVVDWIKMAKELGLDGIEMYHAYLINWDLRYLKELAKAIRDVGLEISMFTDTNDFAHPEKEQRKRQVDSLKRSIDAAKIFGTRIVRVTAGNWHAAISREGSLQNVVHGLELVMGYAAERGITLALEDHPQIGAKIADFMAILDKIHELRVNLDTSNPLVEGEDPVELTKLVKDRVVHVHASDRNHKLEHVVFGDGIVDFISIFKTLKGNGFDGWISLEAGGTEGKMDIKRGMEAAREAWERA